MTPSSQASSHPTATTALSALAAAGDAVVQMRPGKPRSPDAVGSKETIELNEFDPVQIQTRYREVLQELADGDRKTAINRLSQLEAKNSGPTSSSQAGRLLKAQAAVIYELAEAEPELLIPIMMLHHDASGQYRDQQIWHLAGHSRRLAGLLATTYVREVDSQGSRVVASRALASLGGFLQQSMSTHFCRCTEFYDRALDIDPTNEAALMGMATVFEKSGDYNSSLPFLRRLVKAHPRNLEARLRLAMNLLRTGRVRPAQEVLTEIVALDRPAWQVALAYQELARTQIDEQEYDIAEQTLQAGIALFPESQRLRVQLSFVYERTRRMKEAQELLDIVHKMPVAQRNTPRWRYNRWPYEVMSRTRDELRMAAESRMPLLEAALEKRGGRR